MISLLVAHQVGDSIKVKVWHLESVGAGKYASEYALASLEEF